MRLSRGAVLRLLRSPIGWLVLAAGLVCVIDGVVTLVGQPFMVDLEIPLRAAARWAAGGQPYLAAAFGPDVRAYDLPFLYPPPVLPLLAPLAALPRPLVAAAWIALTLGVAIRLLRALGVPRWAVPLGLAWVPFSEGLVGGNAQVLLVAAFAAVFFDRSAGPWTPTPRDPGAPAPRPALLDGIAVAVTPALKASQPHAWVALLRRRPSAGVVGLLAMALLAAATLPVTGLDPWRAWLEQLGRAADPAWALRGSSLVQVFPPLVAVGLTAASVAAVLVVPSRRLGVWSGTLLVLGAPSLRNFGALFLLPALLAIRREAALVAVILIGLGVAPAVWAGIALVVVALAMAEMAARDGLHSGPWTTRSAAPGG